MGPIQSPDLSAFSIQILGAALFCAVFLFLWLRSGALYFGLWSGAWAAKSIALLCGFQYYAGRSLGWLVPYAFFEFGFAVFLLSAAMLGMRRSNGSWRKTFRVMFVFPVVLAIALLLRGHGYPPMHELAVALVFLYNIAAIWRGGFGRRLFAGGLAGLAIASVLRVFGPAVAIPYGNAFELLLYSLVAFAAMAVWVEHQDVRVREIGAELDRVRRESATNMDLDHLTGLLNQSALARRVEETPKFTGVVSVCDMDNFKHINDRFGHLTGDEILRNIGHLLRSSVRSEDEAFRWGGDEFVVLFHEQKLSVAENRMKEIEDRLRGFRVRGLGSLPISFSWGAAETTGGSLRETLDEADRHMYERKRKRER